MKSQMFTIICTSCKGSSVIRLNETVQGKIIEWLKIGKVISGRERLDMNMGWQCYCGNNSLMTKQELEHITNKSQPEPKEIMEIRNNLIPEIETGFVMEAM